MSTSALGGRLATAVVQDIEADGTPTVDFGDGEGQSARVATSVTELKPGDEVLVLVEPTSDACPVIVSGIADRLTEPAPADLNLSAGRSLTLRCGEASIELQADGTIEIHGVHVESYAEGIQRIKGAKVRIN
ncbi:MAG: hypothetical protein AAF721_01470 [Myxococcota bacterium]